MSELDLAVIDKAIALLEAGPLVFEGTEYHYSCYALRMARDLTVYYRDDRNDPYLTAYVAFSAEKFGVGVRPSDHFALNGYHKNYFDLVPNWWSVNGKPYTEERVAHLKAFRQHLTEAA